MTITTSLEKAWQLEEVLKERIVIIDGAMGTMIQVSDDEDIEDNNYQLILPDSPLKLDAQTGRRRL